MNKTGKGYFSTIITEDQVEAIIALYKNGNSLTSISKSIKISRNSVKNKLVEKNLYTPFKKNNYQINYNFFSTVDTEEKAYWLGFIAADGCVQITKKGKYLSISLKWNDKDHLLKFKESLQSNHPIKKTFHKTKYRCHENATITIWSTKIVDSLVKLDIIPRKSYCLKWPENLPNNLIKHFVRGHFDGDGSWYLQKKKYPTFSVVGYTHFIESLQLCLIKNCNLSTNKIIPTTKSYTSRVLYTGGKQCHKLYNWMYDDAVIWMDRKKDVVKNYFIHKVND